LQLGVKQGIVKNENVSQLAVHIIATIDGLSILALGDALTEEIIDAQFAILRNTIKKEI